MRRFFVVTSILIGISLSGFSKPVKEKKVWKVTNALVAENNSRQAASYMRKHYDAVIERKAEFNVLLGEQYGKIKMIDSALYFVNLEATSENPEINALAQKQLSKLIPLKDAYKLQMALGKKALYDNQIESAITEFKKAEEIDSGNFEAYFYLGRSLQAAGSNEAAKKRYFSALTKYGEPDNFQGHVLEHVSENYLLMGIYDSCLTYGDSALAVDSGVYDAYLWKGQAWYHMGQFDMGASALEAYVAEDDHNHFAYSILGNCYYEMDRYSSALRAYNASLKIDSVQSEVLSYKAKCHALLRQFELGYQTFRKLENLHENNFYAINGMGVCAYFMKDYELALSHYIKANNLTDNMWFKFNLGLCYQELGQYDNAIVMYDQVQAKQKWMPEVIVKKTECLLAAKEYKKLLAYTDEVINIGDQFPFIREIYLARAEMYKAQGNKAKSDKNLKIASYVKGQMQINTYPRIE